MLPKVSKRVLNMFWGKFSKNFCPVFHGRSSLRKFSKKSKKLQNSKKCPKSFPKASKLVLNLFWVKFFENFFCPVFRGGSSFRKFSKKNSNFQKSPKVFPNVSKRVLNMFLGKFFEKFLPSFPWNIESPKIFEKKIFSKFQKAQKCSQKYPNVFYGDFFEKKIMPSVPWRVEFSKNFIFFFKIPKTPKIVPQRIQTCFDCNLGQFFSKNFCPVFHGRSSLRKFSKKSKKVSNFLKCPKSFPKVSKCVLNVFWGKLFEKFLPSFPWKVESSKNFKKIKKFAKFQKCPKSFPKYPNVF